MELLVPGDQVAVLLCIADVQCVCETSHLPMEHTFQMLDGAGGAGAERLTYRDGQLQRDPPTHVVGNGVFGGHDGDIQGLLVGSFQTWELRICFNY